MTTNFQNVKSSVHIEEGVEFALYRKSDTHKTLGTASMD